MRQFYVVAALLAGLAQAAWAADNLVPNGGFEEIAGGLPAGWRANSQYPFAEVATSTGGAREVRSGQRALRLVQTAKRADGTAVDGSFYTDDGIAVDAGRPYTLGFWARGAGTIQAGVYCYRGRGAAANFVAAPAGTALARLGGEGPYALKADDPWQECRYTFALPAGADVDEIRLALTAHGNVLVDDVTLGLQAATAAAPAAADEPRARPNLIGVGRASTAPRLDGRLDDDEYALRVSGLVDADAQSVYTPGGDFALSWDGARLYLGARVQLPPGYKLQSLASHRDDPALIATRDVFYLMLRPDTQVGARTYEGAYLAVAPEGLLYDAWEQISWSEGYCRRDSDWNADWQVRSVVRGEEWTLELSAPLAALRLNATDAGARCLASFGFHLPPQRVTWQAHPNWFDHFAAFGEVALSPRAISLHATGLQGLQQGQLDRLVRLRNPGAGPAPCDLTFLVSTPTMVGGQVAGWAFETALGVQPREVVGDREVYRSQQPLNVPAGGEQAARAQAQMPQLGHYVLETVARLGDEPVLYQKLPFHYLPPISGTLTPIPSRELIRAELSFAGASPQQHGQFEITLRDAAGKTALSQSGPVRATTMTVPVSMAKLPPGDYRVGLSLRDKAGQPVHTYDTTFRKWAPPAWQQHPVGLEALRPNWCPAPWTPLQWRGGEVSLWGRTLRFDSSGLIAGLTTQGQPLLPAPVTVRMRAQGKEHVFRLTAPRFPRRARGRAEIVHDGTAPGLKLQATQRLEFDGMDLLRLTVTPLQAQRVESLWVEIPLQDAPYGYLSWMESLHQHAWQAGLIGDEDFAAPRRYTNFWLGNDRVGCGFFMESSKGCLIDARQPRVTMSSDGPRRVLRILLVNTPAEIKAPLQATFGLQPTPVKPFFAGWRDLRPQGLGIVPPPANLVMPSPDYWNSGYSKPSPRNWNVLNDMLKLVHGRGQRAYPYIGLYYVSPYDYIKRDYPFDMYENGRGVPADSQYKTAEQATRLEEWFYFQEDWNLSPAYVSHPTPETRSEARVSAGSRSYADFFVHGVAEMLKRTDLDGLYLDIDNPVMNLDASQGLLYKTLDGASEGTVELLGARDMYKRLYCVFDQLRGPQRKPYLLGHGAPHAFPYMSFWDVCFHGEEVKPGDHFEATKMFLQKRLVGQPCALVDDKQGRDWEAYYYRAASNGIPYGLPIMYLPQYGYDPKLKTAAHAREHLAWTFMHNSLLWPAYIPADPVYAFWSKVEVPYGLGTAQFHPYWENGIVARPECVKVSVWTKPGGPALLAVANWSSEPVLAQVQVPATYRGKARDMESDERVVIAEAWTVSVPPRDLRVFVQE